MLGPGRPAAAEWGDPDTSAFHLALGAGTELTNEQYYEDAFLDSISLGRRLVSSPESRVAGLAVASLQGTRGLGAVRYRVRNELSLGDKLQHDALWAQWRHDVTFDWQAEATPRFEYRRDRSFDRDLREWRGSITTRARRTFADRTGYAQLGANAEFLRSSGEGALYLLDRNAGGISFGLGRSPLFGSDWRLGYRLTRRVFPDSSERDHLEHEWEGLWWRSSAGGVQVSLMADAARRSTLEAAPTSRDRFWRGEGAVEAVGPLVGSFGWKARFEAEGLEYDREDTTLFFDYRILRAHLAPRFARGGWSLALGPRAEMLSSPRDPSEEYREIAALAEVELFTGGAWWSVTPAAGWRDYGEAAETDTLGLGGLHSSYAFAEIGMLAEQPLTDAVRLHLLATARREWHIDAAQDARSLYVSLDLRREF